MKKYEFFAGEYDIAVIGAGHAGIEASLAAARLGCKTIVFTLNLDWIGNLACNPSIGGTSKGHLVREIDSLGGEMAKAADKTTIQNRLLNLGKGPAVHSIRAQVDRREYSDYMKTALESQEGLSLKQAEITSLQKTENDLWELKTHLNAKYLAKIVIIATGTFLKSMIYVGDNAISAGPDGMFPADALSESLYKLDIELRRFKTGTPARVNRKSINFENTEPQYGDKDITPFSFEYKDYPKNTHPCYITYTNEKTKQIITSNVHRSAMYSGVIEGTGARYCPSIEDKFVRFADKDRHQIFIEPCGKDTQEMYLQGLSSSLPEDVLLEAMHSIKGLENVEVMRNAYAIEYECVDPIALKPTLEFMDIKNLYGAGQFNGSSGYEEAAAQGLVAGINAAHSILGKNSLILERSGSYIGTLIDDLVTKGCNEPYRMMTSRSEYRLLLRQDNADLRLVETGYNIGLVSKERYEILQKKIKDIEEEKKRAEKTIIPPTENFNTLLVSHETSPIKTGIKLSELLKRPQLNYEILAPFDKNRPQISPEVLQQVEISLKYEGYIKRQQAQVAEMQRLESKLIPESLDYANIVNLRTEAREKLSRIRPQSLGQASRISGVSPADISVLLIYLQRQE